MKTRTTIDMKNYMKYICVVVIVLSNSISMWGSGEYDLPLTITATGCTYTGTRTGDNAKITAAEWSSRSNIVLPFTVTSGYDASGPLSVSWTTGGGTYSYGWSWSETDGELTLYGSSLAPKYGTSVTVTIVFESTCSGTPLATPTGMATSAIAHNGATFSWTAVANASSYRLLITDANDDFEYDNITGTSKVVTGLSPETDYIWKVRANGDGTTYCNSDECATQDLTTSALPTYTVSFWVANGSAPAAQTGSSITLPSIPSVCSVAAADGWSPYGWSEDSIAANSSSATVYEAGDEYIPARDSTLYAVYRKGGSTLSSSTAFVRQTGTFPTSGTVILTQVQAPSSAISNTITGNFVSHIGSGEVTFSTNMTTTNANAVWQVSSTTISGTTYYMFQNLVTGKYLGMNSSFNGVLLDDATTDNAKWYIDKTSKNGFYLKNNATHYYLNYNASSSGWRGASSYDGTKDHIYVWLCSSSLSVTGSTYQSALSCTTTYNVFYDDNGADKGAVPTDATNYTSGTTVTVAANSGSLERTGYTFGGWNTLANGSGTTYTAGSGTFSITANTTLYAKWNINQYNVAVASKDKLTMTATPSGGSAIANANVNYGTTVTLAYSGLDASATFIQWKVTKQTGGDDVSDVLLADKTANNTTFSMPDYAVNVSCVLMAQLRTSCNIVVTYHHADGTTVEKVALNGHPTGYTPADCENKRFMGWALSDPTSSLAQSAPTMTDPTSITVTQDTNFYAVYASPNGGKVTGSETLTYTENFNSLAMAVASYPASYTWTTGNVRWESQSMCITEYTYSGVQRKNARFIQSHSPAYLITKNKIHDLSKITFTAHRGGTSTLVVQYSHDGTAWSPITQANGTGITWTIATTGFTEQTVDITQSNIPIGDYFIRFVISSSENSAQLNIDDIQFYTQSRSMWYSDYSNGCDVAGSATLTYKDTDGSTTIGTPHAAAPSVPEAYTVEAQTKAGYTFDYITVDGQTYAAGDTYLLAHDVNATITWKENPTISGDVYVTAGYTNPAAQTVQSSMTVTATTTENKTGTLTIANATGSEGGNFVAVISDATVADAPLNATIAIRYTPTQAGVEETATMTATIDGASSTFTVHGRSLPAEFVIAAKQGNNWYALPADIGTAFTTIAGTMISVDNNTNPTKAVLTRTGTKYAFYQGYGNKVDTVRFATVAEDASGRHALGASTSSDETKIKDDAAIAGANHNYYKWQMTTTDNTTYTLHSLAGNDKDLRLNSSVVWGTYASGVNSLRFLPIENEIAEATGLTVEEWYPTKVRIKTTDAIASAQVALNGADLAAATHTAKGTNYYDIVTPSLTTAAAATGTLTVKYTTTGSADYAKVFTVPVIISNETTNVSSDDVLTELTKNVYNEADLIVRDNAVLTINGTYNNDNTFRNVWIMPTGKIVVPSDKRLTVSSLNLFGGIDEIYNGSTYTTEKYGVPEFSLKGNLYRVNGNTDYSSATYYMRTDVEQMYSFGAPCQIDFSDIKYADGTTATATTDFYAEAYNGARRAEGRLGGNWIYEDAFANQRFDRGGGYLIAAETQNDETYAVLKMPMTISETDYGVSVTAYGDGTGVADVHKGWNFISNPFMVTTAPNHLTVQPETGSDKDFDYVTIPDEATWWQSFYDQYCVSEGVLKPFKSFFVQVDVTGTITFDNSVRQAPMRHLEEADEEPHPEVFYTVNLTGGTSKAGSFGIRLSDEYTEEYEIGKDLEYMTPAGHAAYTYYNGYRLKYNAMSPIASQIAIPVGYTAREAGTYTWTLNAYTNGQDLEHVYLTDYEQEVTHDLLTGPYEFTTAVQTENQTRFAISSVVGEHKAPTGTDLLEQDSGGGGPVKFIYHDKMYILNDNIIYDATGKRVKVLSNGQEGGRL